MVNLFKIFWRGLVIACTADFFFTNFTITNNLGVEINSVVKGFGYTPSYAISLVLLGYLRRVGKTIKYVTVVLGLVFVFYLLVLLNHNNVLNIF